MLTTKRMREHLALFASLLGVVAIVCGLGVGLTGFLATAATDGIRADLASRTGSAVGLELSLVRAPDAEAQDVEVREAFAAAFTTDGRPVPFEIDRSVSALSTAVPFVRLDAEGQLADPGEGEDPLDPDADGRSIVLSIPDLQERSELVDGSWPASATEVSVQADAAALLGLVPGDRIRLGAADLTVTGTWRVLDPLDPHWLGDELVTGGFDADDVGPIIVDESAWTSIGVTAWGRWTLVPIADQMTVADLDTIARVWDDLSRTLKSVSELDTSTLNRDGQLARTAIQIVSRVHALEAVRPIALLIIGAIAVIALLELARLLAGVRSNETELLWSRGASASSLMRSTALETALAAVLGAVIGTAAAAGALTLASGRLDAVTSAGAAVWIVPVAAVVVAVGVFAFTAYRAARRPLGRDTATVSGRARSIAGIGGVVLVVAAAGISTWQLLLYGSPLTPTADGGLEVDPIAVLAPALALVAIVLAGLVAFPFVAPLVERAARNGTGAPGVLAARSVARRLQFAATPIVLVALACGQLVVAAAYSSTWANAYDETQQLRSGSAMRVLTGLEGLSTTDRDRIVAADGVTSIAPVQLVNVAIGNDYASLVAATPTAFGALANDALGALDPQAMAGQIAVKPYSPELPVDATGLHLVVATTDFEVAPFVLARLADGFGNSVAVELTATEAPADASTEEGTRLWSYDADVPAARGDSGWRVLALDVLAEPTATERTIALESLAGAGADGDPVELGDNWIGRTFDGGPSVLEALASGLAFPVEPGAEFVRLLPTFDDRTTDGLLAPIVVSAELADRYSLEVGDTVPVGIIDNDDRFTCVVTGIVPGIPGASSEVAMLMDSAILEGLQLRDDTDPEVPRQFWIRADDPATVAPTLRAELPPQVRIDALAIDPARTMLNSASLALWIGAIGSALLAVVAVSTVAGAQLRSRRAEVIILRAVGLSSGSLAGIRRRELLIVLGYGILVGLVSGIVITVLELATLARAAVPDPYRSLPTAVHLNAPLLAIGLCALAALLAAVVGIYGLRVAAQARTLSAREEVR